MLCAMLAAIAGILDFSFIQTSQPNIGLSLDLSGLRRRDHRRRQPDRRQGHHHRHLGGALLLAELQHGLALLSPGPHVQQMFLGAVTIGAVALDLFLTKLRKSRAA